MTAGTNWYSYTLSPPSNVAGGDIRVIFNDGQNQTPDLSRSTDGWYDGSTWSNNCPGNCPSSSARLAGNVASSVVESKVFNTDLSIYPNPFNDKINIKGLEPGIYSLSIRDVTGRTVLNDEVLVQRQKLEITPELKPGTYLIELENEKFKLTYRIVKE